MKEYVFIVEDENKRFALGFGSYKTGEGSYLAVSHPNDWKVDTISIIQDVKIISKTSNIRQELYSADKLFIKSISRFYRRDFQGH